MNQLRKRAKNNFPSVLLTLLSIVQAVALELLWEHLHDAPYLFNFSWVAIISWAQIAATLLGVILIWVVYAGNAMRFLWVPSTGDSVYPFFIGVTEFLLIETLGPEQIGIWLIFMAVIFAAMVWGSHTILRSARLDGGNDSYFKNSKPAVLRDFAPHIIIISSILVAGLYMHFLGSVGAVAFIIILATLLMLAWQYYQSAKFWESSIAEDDEA